MEPLSLASPLTRRSFCRLTSLSTLGWMAAGAQALADQSESVVAPRSMILLWLSGGPSQFETFDPHPGGEFGGPTKAIPTVVPGIQLAEGLPRVAEQVSSLAIIRSMVSKEGDHGRAQYLMKTGYRPNPSVLHPSVGAIATAHLPVGSTEIPRYVSILSSDRHSRGGYLGETQDPFLMGDPKDPAPDVIAPVSKDRLARRIQGLDVVEAALRRQNPKLAERTLHREQITRGMKMMDSEQLAAFRIEDEPTALRERYGDTPFGRGCLCARRLVEVGVRCIEVELNGWDTHANNFSGHETQNAILDPALATLLADLRERDLLKSTLVVCAGEFGRTPKINPLDGRDHWNKGFSVALAGAGVRGGQVYGAADPAGKEEPVDPVTVDDFYATVLTALGINPSIEHITPIGRPIKLSEGKPLRQVLPA